jgi:RHS repeat-associated protein
MTCGCGIGCGARYTRGASCCGSGTRTRGSRGSRGGASRRSGAGCGTACGAGCGSACKGGRSVGGRSRGGGADCISASFQYDALNRLREYSVDAPAIPNLRRTVVLQYNAIGSILYKSDVGVYSYPASGNAAVRAHAVARIEGSAVVDYGYDASGNLVSATGAKYRKLTYTSFNLPDGQYGIEGANGARITYGYDADLARVRETRTSSAGTRTTWYLHPDNAGALAFEREVAENGSVSNRHYLGGGGGTLAVLITRGALPADPIAAPGAATALNLTVAKLEYWHRDHLGSIAATTDAAAAVSARYSYDPFGKRRHADGQYDAFGTLVIDWRSDLGAGTDRGFTGHEHLDEVGLIHMNGRLYDAHIGRFLQADPVIQEPLLLQNFNRYSYVMNNPLNATDPSGYFWKTLERKIRKEWKRSVLFRQLVAIAVAAWLGPVGNGLASIGIAHPVAVGAISGFASGAVSSGNLDGALQGMISGAVFAGVGKVFGKVSWAGDPGKFMGAVLAHGVAGCAMSSAQGGKCSQGFLSASFSKVATTWTGGLDGVTGTIVHAVVGGTGSVLGGGKFGNGAMTGAFSYLFNDHAHAMRAERRYRVEVLIGDSEFHYESTGGIGDQLASLGGHAAVVVDGIVYSKTGTGLDSPGKLTREQYLTAQAFRNTTSISFNASFEEIQAMSTYINSSGSHGQRPYSVFLSNCADTVGNALFAAGIINRPPSMPLFAPLILQSRLLWQIRRPVDVTAIPEKR